MNIYSLLDEITQKYPELAQYDCLINGVFYRLSEIDKDGFDDFHVRSRVNMPTKLYKYFPNTWTTLEDRKKPVNYSMQALENNTVFLQSPNLFDDVYDSSICVDKLKYITARIRKYCYYCDCDIHTNASLQDMIFSLATAFYNVYKDTNNSYDAFKIKPAQENAQLQNEIFAHAVDRYLLTENDWDPAIIKAIHKEYQDLLNGLQTTFRTTCFTTTPFSQLMWGGAYADFHKGFCIEYHIDQDSEYFKDVFFQLYPMIYCKTRTDIFDKIIEWKEDGYSEHKIWDIYFHGALRKSIDWAYQNEWRLLLPQGMEEYNIPFFPISKVFLGNRMNRYERKEVIEVCKQKKIPYTGVTKNNNYFEMQECEILCEDCSNYKD